MFRWLSWHKPDCYLGHSAAEWYAFYRRRTFPGNDPKSVNAALVEALSDPKCLQTRDIDDVCDLAVVLTTDAREGVRCLAAIKIGIEKRDCETSLLAALQDASETVRRTAALALVDLNTVRGLAAVVAGPHHGHAVRTLAAQQLRQHGAAALNAIPSLIALLRDPEINWRSHLAAVDALVEIGQPAVAWLVSGLRSGDVQLRRYSAVALKIINRTPEHLAAIDQELAKHQEKWSKDAFDQRHGHELS